MKEFYRIPIPENGFELQKTCLHKKFDEMKDYQLIDYLLENSLDENDDFLSTLGVSSKKKYVLTLFEISTEKVEKKQETDVAYSLLAGILDEAINQFSLTVKSTMVKNKLCYIFFVETGTEIRKMQILLEYGMKSVSHTYSVFGFEMICTSSNAHSDVSTLSTAYHEALELLFNKKKTKPTGMQYYMDNKTPFKNSYYYPLNKEQYIINCLAVGDYQNVSIELDNIFSVNFDDSKLMPLETAKCFFMNLAGTVLKAYDNQEISENAPDIDSNSFIRLILNCTDIQTMITATKDFFRTCCDEIKVYSIDCGETLCADIAGYINRNIPDTTLNVTTIASRFNIHQNHLSKVFKKQTGMNLHAYINSVRVKEAKRLLSQSNITLEEICKRTGFGSYRTFMRVFHQFTNMSPSEYKKLIQPE